MSVTTALLVCAVAIGVVPEGRAAQTPPQVPPPAPSETLPKLPAEPTFNLFTPAQDIEIGRASAKEAERQLRLYVDPELDRYLNRVVARLAAVAPGAKYPYRVRVIEGADANAFSMPGGPIYITRAALVETETEPEVAAILAHEIAHIAMRHGTDHASKIYLGKSGFGLLGGLRGKRSHEPAQMINEIGGVGLNLAFLKFFDDDEYEADAIGARILAQAGYDPNVIATLEARTRARDLRDSVRYARFYASHPPGAERDERLRQELGALSLKPAGEIGGFGSLHARLVASPAAKALAHPWPSDSAGSDGKKAEPVIVRIPMPSASVTPFRHRTGFFTLNRPTEWLPHDSASGFGAVIAPLGGVLDLPNGAQTVVRGIIVNHYSPFERETGRIRQSTKRYFAPLVYTKGKRGALEDATDDLVRLVLWTNPYLTASNASARKERLGGAPAYSVLMNGLSPLTGEEEQVMVFTRLLPDDHIIFALCIAAARDFELLEPVFRRMVESMRVNDGVVHKATGILGRE